MKLQNNAAQIQQSYSKNLRQNKNTYTANTVIPQVNEISFNGGGNLGAKTRKFALIALALVSTVGSGLSSCVTTPREAKLLQTQDSLRLVANTIRTKIESIKIKHTYATKDKDIKLYSDSIALLENKLGTVFDKQSETYAALKKIK